jgi:nicotinic acid mononucleotide adenylyltransferase
MFVVGRRGGSPTIRDTSVMPGRAAYPGSFDPLTIAHLGIAEAARDRHDLDRVDLVISEVALAKEDRACVRLDERVMAIRLAMRSRPWLGVEVTRLQYVSDIAETYDLVIVGADKWDQLHDPRFHDSPEAHEVALAKLPRPLIVPRPPWPVPDEHRLDVPEHLAEISATAVRVGRAEWLAPEAREVGAWD